MKSSELTQEIDAAIVGMQAELDPAPKDSLNPHFKSRYSDLAACKAAAKPALAKHSLGVIQSIQTNLTDGTAGVVTRLIHKSGQWYQSEAWCKPKSLSPQDVGSVATYFRRYEFCAMVGLSSEEDDDGNAATGKPQGQQAKKMEDAVRAPQKAIEELSEEPYSNDNQAHKRALVDVFKTLGITEPTTMKRAVAWLEDERVWINDLKAALAYWIKMVDVEA